MLAFQCFPSIFGHFLSFRHNLRTVFKHHTIQREVYKGAAAVLNNFCAFQTEKCVSIQDCATTTEDCPSFCFHVSASVPSCNCSSIVNVTRRFLKKRVSHLCISSYGQGTKWDDPFTLKKKPRTKKKLTWYEQKQKLQYHLGVLSFRDQKRTEYSVMKRFSLRSLKQSFIRWKMYQSKSEYNTEILICQEEVMVMKMVKFRSLFSPINYYTISRNKGQESEQYGYCFINIEQLN